MIKNAIDIIKESVDNRLEKDRTEKYSNYENGKIEENPNPHFKTDKIEELTVGRRWENTPVKEISELSEDEIVKKINIEEVENKLDYSSVSEVIDPEKVYAGEEVKGCPIEDKLEIINGKILKVNFIEDMVRAITPGQGVVLYDENHKVIASAFII